MVTLEQQIGAKLVFLMPKGSYTFEVQAHLHDDYGLCFALVHDGNSYQDAQLVNTQFTDTVLEEILSLLYLLQAQKNMVIGGSVRSPLMLISMFNLIFHKCFVMLTLMVMMRY